MSKLIGQGGFGCVYYPKISCDGKSTKNNKYVSKLQIYSSEVNRELKLGKKISEIPYFNFHFGVITSSCKVNIASFNNKNILKDCEVIKNNPDENYILSSIPYISGKELKDYYLSILDERTYLFVTLNCYYFLINSLQILDNFRICHYDIKFENILYNNKDRNPVIIDFGLSWNYSEVDNFKNISDLKSYFYTYAPTYYIWCPEIQFISLLVNHANKDNILNKEIIKKVIDQLVDGMGIWDNFSTNFQEEYKKSLYKFYERFLDKDNKYVIQELLKYKSTWDTYSIGISFLKQYLKKIKKIEDKRIKEFMYSIIELFLYNISCNPENRPSFEKIKQVLYNTFIQDFKSKEKNEYFEYNFSLSDYDFYKKDIIPYLHFFKN